MSETKTPRTDSEEIKLKSRGNWHGEISVVGSDFSRQLETELAAANERAEAYKEIAEWFAHHFSEECGELDHAHDKAFHKNDQDCPVVIKGRTMKAKLEALNQSIKKTGAEI